MSIYLDYGALAATLPDPVLRAPTPSFPPREDRWRYAAIAAEFGTHGCSVKDCPFHDRKDAFYKCALNLSDAILLAGHTLPPAKNVNRCAHGRVRNADGMARVVRVAVGPAAVKGWDRRPTWPGIVYFEGGPNLTGATGHIDLWNGSQALHAQYEDAETIWFFRLDR